MDENKLLKETHFNVQDYLSAPGAEVILRSPDDKSVSVTKLIAILNRVAAQDENRRIQFWIKLDE